MATGSPMGPVQGIALRTQRFRLDWTLRFTHTTVVIDGQKHEVPWGQHFFPLDSGSHQVEVSYPYLRLPQAGKASLMIAVVPNKVVQLSYRAPVSVLIASSPGTLRVE